MESLHRFVLRRRAIVLIIIAFVSLLLLSSSPHRKSKAVVQTATSAQVLIKSTDNFSPTEHSSSTDSSNVTICTNCSLALDFLPRLPVAQRKSISRFNEHKSLKSSLSIIYSYKIPLILVEPCILWQMLTPVEKDDLKTRKSVSNLTAPCDKLNSKGNVFTFVLLEKYNESTWKLIGESLEANKFKVQFVKQHERLDHVIVKRMSSVLHIAIAHERGDMHTISPVTLSSKDRNHLIQREQLRLWQFERAFEKIQPMAVEIDSQYLMIPKSYKRFLFELPHSRFLECRHDLAKKWQEKYALTADVQERLNSTLTVMRHLIFDSHLPIWMDGGSLLGWARHCSAIVHERDADFASWTDIHDHKYNLTNNIIHALHAPWYMIETFGLPWAAYELRIFNVKLNWQVDLFFMTPDEQEPSAVYSGYHTFPAVSYYKVYYEKKFFDTLCSAEIYGMKILVPCAYEDVLTSEYGETWTIPDAHHFVRGQARTHISSWQLHEAPYAYQCLGRYQFDVREMNHSLYKYNETIHESGSTFSQPIQDILNQFKKTCDHFRWDRTS